MKSLKSKLKILLFSSGIFFMFSIIWQITLVFRIFPTYFPANSGFNVFLNYLGSGGLGILFVIFIITFVSMIFVTNKIDNTDNDKKVKSEKSNFKNIKYKSIKLLIAINIVFALFWFIKVQAEIEGSPTFNGKEYSVYYKGHFVKSITEEQYLLYVNKDAKVTSYLFTSFFLLFSGMMFLSLLQTNKDFNKQIY